MGATLRGCRPTKSPSCGLPRRRKARRVFSRMTVLENLQMGATVADPAHFNEDLERVCTLFPLLQTRIHQRGGTLSGGEQQMLAIGRALMSRPRLAAARRAFSLGLAPLLVKPITSAIRELNERDKLTVFLVEQNAFHALKLAHRGYVIVNGLVTLSGSGRELLERPEVRAAYLEGGKVSGTTRGHERRHEPDGRPLMPWKILSNVVLVTVAIRRLGGVDGRTDAIAQTWRPLWHIAAYMALLGAAVRFIHFALFDGESVVSDYIVSGRHDLSRRGRCPCLAGLP